EREGFRIIFLRIHLAEAGGDVVEVSTGLLASHSGAKRADAPHATRGTVFKRAVTLDLLLVDDRYPEVGLIEKLCATEARLRYAEHSIGMLVDLHHAPDHAWIGVEAVAPVPVIEPHIRPAIKAGFSGAMKVLAK